MNIILKMCMLVFIIMLSLSAGCGKSRISENEPNNHFNQANIVEEESLITGNFQSATDKDTYKLDLRAYSGDKNILRLTLSGVKGVSTQISIFDERYKLLTRVSDFFMNQDETITNLQLTKSVYYIQLSIERSSSTISFPTENYTLKISALKVKNTEIEPNNTLAVANEIEPNTPVTGYFNPFNTPETSLILEQSLKNYIKVNPRVNIDLEKVLKQDIDFFRVRLPEQEKYNASIVLNATENVNVILILLDGNGKIIEYRNNHGFGSGEGITNLTLQGGRYYYIGVLGYERTINFNPLNDTYTLEFKTHPFTRDQEIEPNNNMNSATPIVSNVMKGYLSPVTDQDWYKLTITPVFMSAIDQSYTGMTDDSGAAGQRPDRIMHVLLKGVEGIDLMFEITDEAGQVVKTINSAGAGGDEEIANFNVSFGKTYYIVVKGAPNNTSESYKKQYQLMVKFRDRQPNEEGEPNDTRSLNFSTYNQIKLDVGLTAYISPGGDVDYFYVTIPSPGKYEIKVTGIPKIKFKVEVFDPEDFAIGSAISRDEGKPALFTKVFTSTGLHYIVVRDTRGNTHYNHSMKYFLTIRKVEAENPGGGESQ